ncbi:uncharacterized protein PG998_001581 [Apiospora kogelbergensis]|uniref:Uncharacterized protein n=1 Tax=Apiospora kogelbergensis TaxID=1337665 RepID=A0AAW0QRN6_9PEZI
MASPVAAVAAVPNGLSEPSQQQQQHHQDSPASQQQDQSQDVDMSDAASQSSTKRKRENSDAAGITEPHQNGAVSSQPRHDTSVVNGTAKPSEADKAAIRDYLLVLERYVHPRIPNRPGVLLLAHYALRCASSLRARVRYIILIRCSFDTTPSILKRPLPDYDPTQEPSAKRQKGEDSKDNAQPSIADKVASDEYSGLDAVVKDIKLAVSDRLADLQAVGVEETASSDDGMAAKVRAFNKKALELFRREMTYPHPTRDPAILKDQSLASDLQSNSGGNMILSVYGEAPRRHLYSSLQQPVATEGHSDGVIRPLREEGLPAGIKIAHTIPFSFPSAIEKDKKSKTLGELFPAPRNLPSLQPPKAPKSTTKGLQVGWHRPELTEKSKYRSGSYFGQNISTGRWLDYSNAAPPSQIMTKKRERALSLAGTKPSSTDLETSEMEALFRGAFSSFAPSKDDSAAMVSSGLISQTMWWHKVGKRNFDRLLESEMPDAAATEDDKDKDIEIPLDEDLIEDAIDTWDDRIDPSLEEMCNPQKSDAEKDVDDILQEVSDMIQTLISFQKNRNLSLPSVVNQNSRYAADPAQSDMLTSGSPVQPSAEETATYETLKAQLAFVIQMLPPFAVARLNSDKLEELNISTKLEIRSDEYQGIMEEDESSARARSVQQTATTPRPMPNRSSSSSSNLQYSGTQYQGTNRTQMPGPGYYGAQTPARAASGMPRPSPSMPPYTQQRSASTSYRPPNGYPAAANYPQQYAKPGHSYNQPNPAYGTPAQNRPPYQPQPPYHPMPNSTPQARYPPGHQPPYQQPPYPQQQPPPGAAPHQAYNPYTNGTPNLPPRNISPHIPHQQPPYMQQQQQQGQPPQQPPPSQQAQAYNHMATPTRPPSYGGQPSMGPNPNHQYYPPAGNSPMPQHSSSQSQHSSQGTAFQTSISPNQVQQAMDQARAKFEVQKNAQKTNAGMRHSISGQGQQVGAPVGLGGIGLGGARPPVPTGANFASSPSPGQHAASPAIPNAPSHMNGNPVGGPQATSAVVPNGVPVNHQQA